MSQNKSNKEAPLQLPLKGGEQGRFPSAFVSRIRQMLPEGEWDDFFNACTEPLPKTVRMVEAKTQKFELCEENINFISKQQKSMNSISEKSSNLAQDQDWTLTPTAISEAFFIDREDRSTALGNTLPHFTGQMYVASLSSLLPVIALGPEPEEKVLDMCAAPGSKSTFIAEKMKNTGLLVVNEPSSSRSKKLSFNLERMGIVNSVLLQNDGTKFHEYFTQEFDKILLDAPCSSEGYGRKDCDFFSKMWSEKKIFAAAKLQKKLIEAAFQILAPGGELVYSTCTTAPEENELVVQWLVDRYGDHLEIIPCDLGDVPSRPGLETWDDENIDPQITKNAHRIWPHIQNEQWNSECFFLIKIRKTSAISRTPPQQKYFTTPLKSLKKNQTAELLSKLKKTFGLDRKLFKDFAFADKDGRLLLTTTQAVGLASKHPHRRLGMEVWDRDGNLSTPFAIHFGKHAENHTVEIDEDFMKKYLSGYDLLLDSPLDYADGSSVILQFKGVALGPGKILNRGKKVKNKLDRSWVMGS